MDYAVIETGGKQYKVTPGQQLKVEKLEAADGDEVAFDKVLLQVSGDQVTLGRPYLSGIKVIGKIIDSGREKKIIVFKYKRKTGYRRKTGHRQYYTLVKILKVGEVSEAAKPEVEIQIQSQGKGEVETTAGMEKSAEKPSTEMVAKTEAKMDKSIEKTVAKAVGKAAPKTEKSKEKQPGKSHKPAAGGKK